MNKASFAVDNIRVIDDRNESQFATVKIDAFASGDNRHNLYVSEETLRKTAYSIYGKPLVWVYDKMYDDAGSHDELEVPCGFVPPDSEMTFSKLEDGRTMLSIVGKIWKKYSGELISIFKRDGKTKPVSVELEVFDSVENDMGTELLDFCYSAITVLGSLVTPAIPNAQANLVAFAKEETDEYNEIYMSEFFYKYDGIDFKIPEAVKNNAKKGLELRKEYKRGGTSVGIASARYLIGHDTISPEKVRHVAKYFPRHKGDNLDQKSPPSNGYIAWLLWGGNPAWKWAQAIVDKMNDVDSKNMSYFGGIKITMPYKSLKDINPALRGIDPPVSLAQANAIAKQADAIGVDKEKNGWAIAISNFKKTHTVKDGRWVKKEFEFAKEDWGTGETVEIDKSKDSMTTGSWGNVDKTALMHKVLKAKNYKTLVHAVYAKVDEGWEEHPSSSLHYPIMQIVGNKAVYNRYGLSSALQRAVGQNESEVVSKVRGIYKKMGLGEGEKEDMSVKEEFVDEMEKEKKFEDEEIEEKKEEQEEEKEEQEEEKEEAKEEKMSSSANLDPRAMLAMLGEETEVYKELAEELEQPEGKMNFEKMCNAMYAKMCKMADDLKKADEKEKAYMAENEDLKKFKSDIESKQFEYEVNACLKDVEDFLPEAKMAELREEAKQFSLDNIDIWKNSVKAKAFSFSKKHNDSKEPRIGLPFVETKFDKRKSLWD